jgi:transcriptional regulator with XRE-family HTH domain
MKTNKRLAALRKLNGITLAELSKEMGGKTPSMVAGHLKDGNISDEWAARFEAAIESILQKRKVKIEKLKTHTESKTQ